MCTTFQVCISFRLARGVTQINTYTNIQVKLGISWAGCSPHVDFDNLTAKYFISRPLLDKKYILISVGMTNKTEIKKFF